MHKTKTIKPAVPQRAPTTSIVTELSPPSSSTTNAESNKRYFINDNRRSHDNPKSNDSSKEELVPETTNSQTGGSGDQSDLLNSVDSGEVNDDPKPFAQRKKLGLLPAFIPID